MEVTLVEKNRNTQYIYNAELIQNKSFFNYTGATPSL